MIESQPGYLSGAYPPRHRETIDRFSRKYEVPPNLVYAVTRWESYLYPAALSPVGALGLFQFMPTTPSELLLSAAAIPATWVPWE